MKQEWQANTTRLSCTIRADIKAAMEALALKRHRIEGGYVGLGRVFAEAARLLLEQEGIPIPDDVPEPPASLPRRPAKSVTRRRKTAVA